MTLFLDLCVEGGTDFGNFFVTTKGFLHPAHHEILGEVCKRDEVLRALEADAAVRRAGVNLIFAFGCNRIVCHKNKTVLSLSFEIGDVPVIGVSHRKTSATLVQ